MKKIILTHIVILFFPILALADNFSTSSTSTLTLKTIDNLLTLTADDISINNIVGGDRITVSHEILSNVNFVRRSATCALSSDSNNITLSDSNGHSFNLNVQLVTGDHDTSSFLGTACKTLTISGDVPETVTPGSTYSAEISFDYSYDAITSLNINTSDNNFQDLNISVQRILNSTNDYAGAF